MTEQQIKAMRELDEAAEDAGGYVDSPPYKVRYNFRKIEKYCQENNIDLLDMRIRDFEQFIEMQE